MANARPSTCELLGVLVLLLLIVGAASAQSADSAVKGRVIDAESGNPIDGARVHYQEQGIDVELNPDPVFTGSSGRFGFYGKGVGIVAVSADGYNTAWRKWSADRVDVDLLFVLTRPKTIQGTVSDATTGEPVAVRVSSFVRYDGGLFTDATTSDDYGVFKMVVPALPARIVVQADDYAPAYDVFKEGEPEKLIPLSRYGGVSGVVLDGEGNRVTGAVVHAGYEANDHTDNLPGWGFFAIDRSTEPGRTGPHGEFAIGELVPELVVELQAVAEDGSLSEIKAVTVEPGRVLETILTLRE